MIWLLVLYLVIVLTGIWLGRSGRPLKMLPSVVHKLLAVALTVLLAFLAFGRLGAVELSETARPAAVAMLAIAVSLVATGAVLSGKVRGKVLVWVHGGQTVLGLVLLGILCISYGT